MRKFNIGDKIKVIGNCNCHGYEIGEEYIIKCFDSICIEPNENGYAYNLDDDVQGETIREKDMELVKPKESICLYCDELEKDKCDLYVKGEWKNMENEVLELWYARKHDKIVDEYEEKEREFNNSKELVIKYKDIIGRFEKELEELYISEENAEKGYVVENLNKSMYQYNIDYDKLNNEFLEEYVIERDNKLRELDGLRKEINAQLSLSSDLEYQVEVLTRYGVLNKKTKKMVD